MLVTSTDIMGRADSTDTDASADDVFEYHGQRGHQNSGAPSNGNSAYDFFRYRDPRQQQYNDGRSFGHPSSDNVWNTVSRRQPSSGVFLRRKHAPPALWQLFNHCS